MKRIVLFFCALTCLLACDKEERGGGTTPETATRSVMIYMAGENNLTATSGVRFLHNDLQEIIEGSKLLSDRQRLFVFVDSLNTAKVGSGTPVILEVHGGEATVKYDFGHDFYSCDPAYFKKVMQWMTENAPAQGYGLVLWGHASGWSASTDTIASSEARATRAYGQDDGKDMTEGSRKWMNITQLARALESLPKLDFIFADCCNMMCAEVGYELRNATSYLIGSPAEIPGDGAPYDQLVPLFYKNRSGLYSSIIDAYYDYYLADYKGDYDLDGFSVPLSVIDTQYMDALAQATHDVLDAFSGGYPYYPLSPSLTDLAYYFYFEAPVMYDMRAFIKSNTTDEVFQKWDETYRLAVPYYRMSLEWMTIYSNLEKSFSKFNQDISQYGCVSMFIPLNIWNYYSGTFRFNHTYNNYGWNRAVDWSRYGWTSESTYVR